MVNHMVASLQPTHLNACGHFLVLSLLFFIGCEQRETVQDANSAASSSAESEADLLSIEMSRAISAMSRGQWDVAEQSLKQVLLIDPNNSKALEWSADVAVERGEASSASVIYEAAIDARGEASDRALLDKWAKSLLRSGRPYDYIGALQTITDRFPADREARYDLAGIATASGVPELAVPILRWLLERGESDADSLMVLADPARVRPDVDSCKKMLSLSGDDRRAEYGLARAAAMDEDWQAVEKRLSPIVEQFPEFVAAHALYGQALFELNEHDKLDAWQAKAPQQASESSLYWLTLGRWEQSRGQHQNAAIAFWESMKSAAVIYPEALPLLLASLTQLNRNKDVDAVSGLMIKYTKLRDAMVLHIERSTKSQAACMQVAEAMLDLGRIWEAEAWARLAVSLPNEKLPDLRERYATIRKQLNEHTPWQLPEATVTKVVDLSDLSPVDFALKVSDPDSAKHPQGRSGYRGQATFLQTLPRLGEITFVDEAAKRGWNHTSIQATKSGLYTIDTTVGGGIAVIDFDGDGWPDLAAATLDGKPLQNNSSPNRLSRNLNGVFVDVTQPAGYQDTGYGQGIAVADYNDDGFADLFDANIGRNRLYRNNGDGTFTDVSDEVGLEGERWTTSAALADLNGDAVLDIFEVNYCAGDEPYKKQCHGEFGATTCSPMTFEAEPDRVWRGSPEGTFVDVSDEWMTETAPGRGLGLVVGQLDEQPGLDVVVSNDMTVNHLWSPRSAEDEFRLVDVGTARGIATSGKSQSQASMGIAAGDADGDGDLDLLMTHFSNEYNTYYEQTSPGFWSDRSYPCGFVESSLKLLGFGTQWIDFDNNGDDELIITNGHIDQLGLKDVGYHMHAQVYARTSKGRWEELDRSGLGEYFQKDHLGRALVRVDANRDGLCDVAISHLGKPAALLINRTMDSGQAITLHLVATASPRDAIGARVTAMVGNRKVTEHLTGGDGYMASNERKLHVSCGSSGPAENVTVHWPSGKVETLGSLASGREFLVVEGTGKAFEVSGGERK
jgi:thioredoxin-like negative regulator of GroEL